MSKIYTNGDIIEVSLDPIWNISTYALFIDFRKFVDINRNILIPYGYGLYIYDKFHTAANNNLTETNFSINDALLCNPIVSLSPIGPTNHFRKISKIKVEFQDLIMPDIVDFPHYVFAKTHHIEDDNIRRARLKEEIQNYDEYPVYRFDEIKRSYYFYAKATFSRCAHLQFGSNHLFGDNVASIEYNKKSNIENSINETDILWGRDVFLPYFMRPLLSNIEKKFRHKLIE